MSLLFAYFDPSAGSLLLQALVGGFGGLVVFGRYLWTKYFVDAPVPQCTSKSQEMTMPSLRQSL